MMPKNWKKILPDAKTELNNMLPELGSQPTEFAMFFENWTFPR